MPFHSVSWSAILPLVRYDVNTLWRVDGTL
jgi:hypothetical protein